MDKLELSIEIDLNEVIEAIEDASNLDNNAHFAKLAQIQIAKNNLKDALDKVEKVERDVKHVINAKAKTLYGNDWSVIAGDNYKITRSFTGSVYDINGTPNAKYLLIKKSVNSEAVKAYAELNDGKLPKGIVPNGGRGESITIKVVNDN